MGLHGTHAGGPLYGVTTIHPYTGERDWPGGSGPDLGLDLTGSAPAAPGSFSNAVLIILCCLALMAYAGW